MRIDLNGRTALVTGASRGIGEAIARRLAEAGADVLCAARGIEAVERVAGEIRGAGGLATAVQLDITPPDVRARVEALLEKKTIEIPGNNAGSTHDHLFIRMQ